jgi:hypothetical protein
VTVVRVPIHAGDDAIAHAEFDVKDTGGMDLLSAGTPGRAASAARALSQSLDTALPALAEVMSKLRHKVADCDEITLQAGLRVGGETGLVFVRGGTDATIGVTVTWRRQPSNPEGGTGSASAPSRGVDDAPDGNTAGEGPSHARP